MAKNKRKSKLTAQNSQVSGLEKQAHVQTQLTAKNALEQALRLSDADNFHWNDSLNACNGYNNISLEMLSQQQILLTYLYKTFGILANIVDIPVDDAYKRGGFDLEAESIDGDELHKLEKHISRMQDIKQIKNARKWARLYGGAAIIVLDGRDLSKPLNKDRLKNNGFELLAVDRWQLIYSEPNINIPGGSWTLTNYGTDQNIASKNIHNSRVIVVKGKEAPYQIMQRVNGWGISVYEQIFQDMSSFFKARNVIFELLDESKIDVLKLATLKEAISSSTGEAALQRMVDMVARNKNYKSQITLATDDEYEQKQIRFSGMSEILKEIRIMIAGASKMPVNKIWGEGVTGFGSGEDSLENYNSQIENEIRTDDTPVIEDVLRLRCYELFGREVEDLEMIWKNLRTLNAIDEQNINDHKLGNALQLFDRQLLSPQEVMEYLKKQQIFIHDTKALKGELEDMPIVPHDRDRTGFEDIVK